MFQSFKYKKYTVNQKDNIHYFEYELTDSKFGITTGSGYMDGNWSSLVLGLATIIIQEYSKRKLNVSANLAIAFKWYNELTPLITIQYSIDYNKKYNPLFTPYEQDLNKYLLLA